VAMSHSTILRNRRATNPDRPGDHPIARSTGILQAKNFSNLPHRQSLGGHRTSPLREPQRRTLPRSDCRQRFPSHPINRVAAFRRNRWPLCLGFRTPRRVAQIQAIISSPLVSGASRREVSRRVLGDVGRGAAGQLRPPHPDFMHGAANAITSKSRQVSVVETVVDLESAREKRQKAQ
jgi:hypothetical protein